MPITSSAKKALRASKRKRVFNMRRKAAVEKYLKSFRKAVVNGDKASAEKLVSALYKTLDKAAKTGYLKLKAAARLKSRAMKSLLKVK